jgi:hypothetical protein
MGHTLVKPSPDADMYVIWSTYTDCPIFYGDRAETFQELGGYIPPGRPCDTCGRDELVLDLLTPYEDEPGLLDDARRRYREAACPAT